MSYKKITVRKSFTCILLWYIFLAVGISQELSESDKNDLAKAKSFNIAGEPYKAIRIYKDLIRKHENDTSLMLGIAQSYSIATEHDKALHWIGRVVENENVMLTEALIENYVNELKLAGRYEVAKLWLEKIKLDLLSDSDASYTSNAALFEDTAYISVTSMDFNSDAADICPVFYKDNLLFYSNRNISGKTNINLAGDAEADLFAYSLAAENSGDQPTLINELMGYGYYEGSFAFYDNFQQSILSKYLISGEKLVLGENKLSGLKLYNAKVDTQRNLIDEFEALPFNIHGYSVAHPNISEDGKILFFASNVPGGEGGSDIYKSQFSDGIWGPPENMGPEINSAYDEFFPYIYHGHTLFFSSNRPGGIGNFDIYKQHLTKAQAVEPQNLGLPINSAEDDYCLIISPHGKSGFFTSNRKESKGAEDIFQFNLKTVSIHDIINEILLEDQFAFVDVNYDRKKTIVVQPADKIPADRETIAMADMPNAAESSETSTSSTSASSIELKIANSHVLDDKETDISFDDNVGIQKVQMIIHAEGKESFKVQLPEQLNLASFFDVKNEIKSTIEKFEAQHQEKNKETQSSTQLLPSKTIFRVQIAASKNPIPATELEQIYKGNREITKFMEESWYKYAIGDFENYFLAAKVKKECNVKDAFIVAYTRENKHPLMAAIKNTYGRFESEVDYHPENIVRKAEIFFDFNTVDVNDKSNADLETFVTALQNDASLNLIIIGYADYYGSETYNHALAAARGNSLQSFFISKGINEYQLKVVSKGEDLKSLEQFNIRQYESENEAAYRKAELLLVRE